MSGTKRKSGNFRKKIAAFHGGDEEDRTLDLTDANRTLSQLSYAPEYVCSMIITKSGANVKMNFL